MNSKLPTALSRLLLLCLIVLGQCVVTPASEARIIFRFPPNPGPPGSRVPGGSRRDDRCVEDGVTPLALMPKSSYGMTLAARPYWYFYLPNLQADALQFQIFNTETQELQRKTYRIPTASGIFEVKAPADLEPEHSYIWSFSIVCNRQNRSNDIVLTGTLERRLDTALITQLKNASPRDRLSLLSEAGLWHDTLRELVIQRIQGSADWGTRWSELFDLEDVAFDTISVTQAQRLKQAPILPLTPVESLQSANYFETRPD